MVDGRGPEQIWHLDTSATTRTVQQRQSPRDDPCLGLGPGGQVARSLIPMRNHPSAPQLHVLSQANSASGGTSTPCNTGNAMG